MIQIKRLLNSTQGTYIISIILGLGLATLFRQVCKDKNCIKFNGSVYKNIDGKIFQYDDKCYSYEAETVKCDAKNKKVIDIKNTKEDFICKKCITPKTTYELDYSPVVWSK